MANIGEGLRDVLLAGIGVVAITGEKAKEMMDNLTAKGAITVDQGKEIVDQLVEKNSISVEQGREIMENLTAKCGAAIDLGKEQGASLTQKVAKGIDDARIGALEARMKLMTPEERLEFAALAAEIAQRENAKGDQPMEAETVMVEEAEEAAAEETAEEAPVAEAPAEA